MAIKSVSPQEAHDLLNQEQGYVYLDVRSVPEFSEGHPASALNVPLLEPDPRTGQMVSNPAFLKVVQANFPRETKLLVGCLSGMRSQKAAEILTRAGYRDLANVRGGFGGAKNSLGRVVEPGWSSLGLPVVREAVPGESYESLRRKGRS